MRELIEKLNEASRAYYAEDREIMDNYTYDALYDELTGLEQSSGIVMSDSPTVSVGYEAVDELPKARHEVPMLSLDKTKDVGTLKNFIGNNKTLLSWKLDGLTVVLTYRNGTLESAVTRGNGEVGEVVTNNAKVFIGLPLTIPYSGELIIRGEAYITYDDFEMINSVIEDADARYKNPRNLCSGSVRQLNNAVTKERRVRFKVFSLVRAEGVDFADSHKAEFDWLSSMGFDVVGYALIDGSEAEEAVKRFSEEVKTNSFPSDGLVALYDGISYGESLGTTAKFPRNALAFKWEDEVRSTHLLKIEWSPSRTGLINPIAVFEPVELEGTTVSRASVHNVSIVRELKLGEGDEILVYKANMIIPQIAKNLTCSGTAQIPGECPVCKKETKIISESDTETLVCTNPDCPVKAVKSFAHFVSRDAMNIEGLSEATLEKFIAAGLISDYADILRLPEHEAEITSLEGFGPKAFMNLVKNIRTAQKTDLVRVIYGFGITGIGLSITRLIVSHFNFDPSLCASADYDELCGIDGIGEVLARNYIQWWESEKNRKRFDELMTLIELSVPDNDMSGNGMISGRTFVITGSLRHFENRSGLRDRITALGGKVTGSVTKNTDYLINNDIDSSSSKNRKAKELGVPVITEDEILEMMQRTD